MKINVTQGEFAAMHQASAELGKHTDSGTQVSGLKPFSVLGPYDERYLEKMARIIGSGAVEAIRDHYRESGEAAEIVVRRDTGWQRVEARRRGSS